MWEETKIEKYLDEKLHSCYNKQEADFFFALYTDAKKYLCDNVYSHIPSIEPELTDHTEKHVKDVLKIVWKLIVKEDDGSCNLNEIEILLLCVSVLFHDVGNLHGRKDHNLKVADIYNTVRANKLEKCQQERSLVLRIVKAHCGYSSRGDKDTLLDLAESNNLFDMPIRLRELAAILRFADELAEGPQRTSQYMLDKGMISKGSLIYHKYASITDIHVDKGNERIVLSYNIDYPLKTRGVSLKNLLKFVYIRILKLDAERRYCKYYAPLLDRFKRTEASIVFTIKGDLCDFDVPKICLEDKYRLIEENVDSLVESMPALNIDAINKTIRGISKTKK